MIKFLDLRAINEQFEDSFINITKGFFNDAHYILGKHLYGFETSFASYCGTDYCLGVGNGLDALVLILEGYKALGKLQEGDEIIVPANTFIATILAISKARLIPVLVEPDESTFNISVENTMQAISPRTKAIMAVHLYGRLAPMKELLQISQEHDLLLLEDAAQAHGAILDGKRSGAWGNAAAFSFYPGKNLGAIGDGGAITTSDSDLYSIIQNLRNYGSDKKYVHTEKGVNSRLDEIQAAFLSVKLERLDEDNEKRMSIAEAFDSGINNPWIQNPVFPNQPLSHVWHLYVIRCARRSELQSYLSHNGVETLIHYPIPPHKQHCYPELNSLQLPLTEKIHDEVLSLPIYPTINADEVNLIIELVNAFT
jgi:dTDP-4-amino-4,6-dideoxygalactose transaminase